tara:strand:+ start:218 stop:793 length:576 start_codon:yes stop_codon:yes gene_type:complete
MKLRKILLLVFAFFTLNLSSQILCEADSVCVGGDELYYSMDSSNIVYWDWIVPSFGTVTQNNGDSIYINWGSPGFYKVGLRVKDNQGCWSDTSWCYVDAIDNSCALQTGINPICVSHPLQQLPINIVTGYPGGIWSGTGIINQNKGEFHVSVAGVGSHVILYEQTSGRCKVECNITITVTSGPLISPIYID